MSEPFLAEIRMVGFNFAPRGWAFCDGQILPINQNQSLYSLLGTTYGGDGRTSFALPDLRSRTPIHRGNGHSLGQKSGAETIMLTAAQIPSHTHAFRASSTAGNDRDSGGKILAGAPIYRPHADSRVTPLRSGSITNTGGGQDHNNMQPYTTVSFTIALQGLFPSRN
jgi:microcystin-dependent protein